MELLQKSTGQDKLKGSHHDNQWLSYNLYERTKKYQMYEKGKNYRQEIEREIFIKWQNRWDKPHGETAAWTKTLILYIQR